MKVALIVGGLLRHYQKTSDNFKAIKNAFKENGISVDTFFSIWDITGEVTGDKTSTASLDSRGWCSFNPVTPGILQEISTQYNPTKIEVEDFEKWKDKNAPAIQSFMDKHNHNHVPQFITNSLFSQYYKVSQAIHLIPSMDDYDYVFKYRTDTQYNPASFGSFLTQLKQKACDFYFPALGGQDRSDNKTGSTDLGLFFTPKTASHLFSFYDWFQYECSPEMIAQSTAPSRFGDHIVPEILLLNYIKAKKMTYCCINFLGPGNQNNWLVR